MQLNNLLSWLRFDNSPTDDFIKSNHWQTFGNPTIGANNAVSSNALQLDGLSYLKLSSAELGGRDFEIDGWVYVDPASPDYARLINIINPSNGYHMVSVRKSATDNTKLDFWYNSYSDLSKDRGYVYTADTVCIGSKVHFKLIYRYTDKRIALCINDKKVASKEDITQFSRQSFDIYIGANPNGSQGLIGSIDELTIHDGTWFAYNYGNVPTADFYQNKECTFKADTKSIVNNLPITWRYENFGSADLLTVAGTTVNNLDETQSKTGSAFYQPTRSKCFDIPNTKEIWVKCDIFTTADYTPTNGDRIRIYSEDSKGVNGWCTFASNEVYALWHNNTLANGSYALSENKLRPFLLHMLSGSNNGVIEYWFPNGISQKWTGNVNEGNDFANFYIQMDGSNILVSNLIISNAPLDIDEDVAELRPNILDLHFDTLRQHFSSLSLLSDAERNVIKAQNQNFSLTRHILSSFSLSNDTRRSIFSKYDLFFDSLRNIVSANLKIIDKKFDVWRKVISSSSSDFDTFRYLIKSLNFLYDIESRTANKFIVNFDSDRNVIQSGAFSIDTARALRNLISDNFDTLRDVIKLWRYENFGSADLLTVAGTTVNNLDETQSKTRSAFWQNQRISAFPIPSSIELWIKFDLFFGGSIWRAFDSSSDTGITVNPQTHSLVAFVNGSQYDLYPSNSISDNTLNSYLLHIFSDSQDGFIELWVDGVKFYSQDFASDSLVFKGNVANGSPLDSFYLFSPDDNNLFSNVIISNSPISLGQNVLGYNLNCFFDFDTDLIIQKIWRYENFGSGSSDNTLSVGREQSLFRSAVSSFSFPDMPDSDEVWVKFDFFTNSEFDLTFAKNSKSIYWFDIKFNKNSSYFYPGHVHFQDFDYSCNNSLRSCLLHVKVGYFQGTSDGDGIIELWLDGVKVAHYIGNVNYGEPLRHLSISHLGTFFGDDFVIFSNIIVSNSEIGLNENCVMPFNASFDLSRNIWIPDFRASFDLNFDLIRNVENIWRYENIGSADSLLVDTNTLTVNQNRAKYLCAFKQTSSKKCFDIPSAYELWIKFDVSIDDPSEQFAIYVYNLDSDFVSISAPQKNAYVLGTPVFTDYFLLSSSLSPTFGSDRATDRTKINKLESVLVHFKSGLSDGIIEAWFNSLHISHIGNVNNGKPLDSVSIFSLYGSVLFSNIIISNESVASYENCKLTFALIPDTRLFVQRLWLGDVWRYENFGSADLLAVNGVTYNSVSKALAVYQSAFYSIADRCNYFNLPSTYEVWIKFDFYFSRSYESLFVGSLDNQKVNQIRLNCLSLTSGNARIIFANESNVSSDTSHQFNSSQLYHAVLHLKSDSTNGLIEFFCSDGFNLSHSGNVNNGNAFENIYIQAGHYNDISSYPRVSNVIISNSPVDLLENTILPFDSRSDLLRKLFRSFLHSDSFDSCRNITQSKVFNYDLSRCIRHDFGFDHDTCRNVTNSIHVDFDTVSSLPHKTFIMPVESDTVISDISVLTQNITDGIKSIEINLASQQLTDQISYSSSTPAAIMQELHGQYLDYHFALRIEKIQKHGVIYSYQCCSDVDEILYRQLDYKIPENDRWHVLSSLGREVFGSVDEAIDAIIFDENAKLKAKRDAIPMGLASSHLLLIANSMGKIPCFFFDDFISTVEVDAGGRTYHDLISSIFGWSSRVPDMLINVFLRDDKLFAIQRGLEPNTVDLTFAKHSIPDITHELVRTSWGAEVWSKTQVCETRIRPIQEQKPVPNSEILNDSVAVEKNDWDGLITSSKIAHEDGSYTVIKYKYETAVNGQIYLVAELATTYASRGSSEIIDEKLTTHAPSLQGKSVVYAEDEDGSFLGSTLSNSIDQRTSPYDNSLIEKGNRKAEEKRKHEILEKQRTIYGLSLFDTSFPVHGDDKLAEITEHIKSLNRKTKETISLSVYDLLHVIDFSDKIIFEGNTYFLESNTIITNSRIINRQDVTFVRWF